GRPLVDSFPRVSAPSAGFDGPVGMLSACHDRLRSRCDTLARLPDHVARHGADGQARDAAQSLLRYFDGPALYHHADEEQDLFPALLESVAGSDATCLRGLFDRLSTEHRQLESQWQRLRPLLLQLREGETLDLPTQDIQAVIAGYAGHLHCAHHELRHLAQRL